MSTLEHGAADLARLAGTLADETRAAMCLAMLDGRAWTAGELARHTGVAASTATEHLDRLVAGGLLTQKRQGRRRYVRLADPGVADLVEALAGHAGPPAAPTGSLRRARAAAVMAQARTCYDHLAGRLGVGLTDAMVHLQLLDQRNGCAVTDAGRTWLDARLNLDLETERPSRRPLARFCLDWTERRPHLAGIAGARICACLLDRGWITRIAGTRAVRVTPSGRSALLDLFGLDTSAA